MSTVSFTTIRHTASLNTSAATTRSTSVTAQFSGGTDVFSATVTMATAQLKPIAKDFYLDTAGDPDRHHVCRR
jgi:hypothetical protein